MNLVITAFTNLGGFSLLFYDFYRSLIRGKFYFKLFIEQLFHVAVRSTPLIVVMAASIGAVMALQYGMGLEKFGGKPYMPKLVSLSLLRELSPVFTGLMLAARVGAGFASEIGSMVVTQQVDAYKALATSPMKVIIVPRVLACLIALPLLTALANVVGLGGALIVSYADMGLDPFFFWKRATTGVVLADYWAGFGKTFFFALFVAIPSCYFGLNVRGGTKSVGIATTRSVVVSSILIMIGDFVLTKVFLVFETWK